MKKWNFLEESDIYREYDKDWKRITEDIINEYKKNGANKMTGKRITINKPKNILTIQLNIYDPTMLKYEAEHWAKKNGYKYEDDAHLFADFILTVDEDNITTHYSYHESPELNEVKK